METTKSDKKILKIAEKYAKKECEDVKDSCIYLPSDIYHLVKMVYMDGFNDGITAEIECIKHSDKNKK